MSIESTTSEKDRRRELADTFRLTAMRLELMAQEARDDGLQDWADELDEAAHDTRIDAERLELTL